MKLTEDQTWALYGKEANERDYKLSIEGETIIAYKRRGHREVFIDLPMPLTSGVVKVTLVANLRNQETLEQLMDTLKAHCRSLNQLVEKYSSKFVNKGDEVEQNYEVPINSREDIVNLLREFNFSK